MVNDRLTDRARIVLQLAKQEADRVDAKYVGTEHILLGIVKEGHSVAANMLANHGVTLRAVRSECEIETYAIRFPLGESIQLCVS